MKKWFIFCLIGGLLCGPAVIWGADVPMKWDAVQGATGYKIYKSIDGGTTWTLLRDVGNVLTWTAVGEPDNVMILYRGSAYNAVGESIRFWSGSWWDTRKLPPNSMSGLGTP